MRYAARYVGTCSKRAFSRFKELLTRNRANIIKIHAHRWPRIVDYKRFCSLCQRTLRRFSPCPDKRGTLHRYAGPREQRYFDGSILSRESHEMRSCITPRGFARMRAHVSFLIEDSKRSVVSIPTAAARQNNPIDLSRARATFDLIGRWPQLRETRTDVDAGSRTMILTKSFISRGYRREQKWMRVNTSRLSHGHLYQLLPLDTSWLLL